MTEVKGYTYHRVFDGYNFLSASGAMEEIVGTDMELVSKADHDAALRRAKAEGMREAGKIARANAELLRPPSRQFELNMVNKAKSEEAGMIADELDARAAQIEEGE